MLLAFAIGILPIRDLSARPADAYDTSAELAQALTQGGFECDFEQQKIGKRVDPGFCRDPEDSTGAGVFIATYVSEEVTDQRVRDHEKCGYFKAVVGPNWKISGESDAEIEGILGAVGGRVMQGGDC